MNSILPTIYPNLDATGDRHQIYVNISRADHRLLTSIVGSQTISSYLAQYAIKHAAAYARRHDLSFADCDRFVLFLRERPPFTSPPSEAGTSHDAGRDAGKGESVANTANVATSTGTYASGGSGDGKGKGSARRRGAKTSKS